MEQIPALEKSLWAAKEWGFITQAREPLEFSRGYAFFRMGIPGFEQILKS